ncbi:MAG TPA: hypothetical protein PKC45_03145, partial [Gemmatales bacterium]|nr:hypothetical protein [Gemmatales bacterium]
NTCRLLATLGLLALVTPRVWADGFILKRGGFLREHTQAAFIEWHAGQQRLFVATHAQSVDAGTMWIVPIVAPPDQVKAEPVTQWPQVRHVHYCKPKVEYRVRSTLFTFALLDSGLLLSPILLSFIGATASDAFSDVTVHDRVVKHGMTIEVLSAVSVSALDEYLTSKQLDVKAKDLWSLAPYLEQQAAIVCGWASGPLEARAMRIDFPSPHIFFPLRPSQVYKDPIRTDIYVRGFASPPAGLHRHWIHVTPVEADMVDGPVGVQLTRVRVSGSPSTWNEDLILEPGGPLSWHVNWFLAFHPLSHPWAVVTWTGLLAGLVLPILLIPRPQREGRDFLLGGPAGAGIGLSLFCTWFLARRWQRLRTQGTTNPAPFTVGDFLLVFIVLHLLLVLGWCVSMSRI